MVVCLFRDDQSNREEYEVAQKYLNTVNRRSLVPDDSLVIGRYSVLPYYKELEDDLKNRGSQLVNSYRQHRYIADFEWYEDLKDLTFRTWTSMVDVPLNVQKFVVKGKTNSRKFDWNTMMYADNRTDALSIAFNLYKDPLIGQQDIIFREYVPLETFEIGINGMPMTNEWRVFFYKGWCVANGFYWSIMDDMSKVDYYSFFCQDGGFNLALQASRLMKDKANFYAIDVAKKADGGWIVVEVNDGQMSGLSTIEPERFYSNLAYSIRMESSLNTMNVQG